MITCKVCHKSGKGINMHIDKYEEIRKKVNPTFMERVKNFFSIDHKLFDLRKIL